MSISRGHRCDSVPTKAARSHSDIKGKRPFDVPAVIYSFGFESHGMGLSREPLHGFTYLLFSIVMAEG